MSEGRKSVVEESKSKGVAAGAAVAGVVVVGALGFPVLATVGAVPAAVLAWRWWKHRAQNGIRF